jgi:hypothetical protein
MSWFFSFYIHHKADSFIYFFLGIFIGKSVFSLMVTILANDSLEGFCWILKLSQATFQRLWLLLLEQKFSKYSFTTNGDVCYLWLGESFNPKNKICWHLGLIPATAEHGIATWFSIHLATELFVAFMQNHDPDLPMFYLLLM